jgi:hypothetical protein
LAGGTEEPEVADERGVGTTSGGPATVASGTAVADGATATGVEISGGGPGSASPEQPIRRAAARRIETAIGAEAI